MAFTSLRDFLSRVGLGTPEQFEEWAKAWRVAVTSGSQESLLGFICRECGVRMQGTVIAHDFILLCAPYVAAFGAAMGDHF